MKFGHAASSLMVLGVLSLSSVPVLADRITFDTGGMNDGAAGNWFDSDNSFFGFGSNLTGPFWGANLTFTDGAKLTDGVTATSSLLTVTGIEILFSASGMSPLSGGLPNIGGADVSTACNVVGTPSFGPSVLTSINCQFADPNFVTNFEALPNSGTQWYEVIKLGGSGGLGHPSNSDAHAVTLTFLTSAPGVPEPGTAGLCLLGLATAVGIFRSKQKKGQA